MNGAQLEIAGQVRNVFPHMVTFGLRKQFLFNAGTFEPTSDLTLDLTQVSIPFDRGPDKSGRVFLAFNGITGYFYCDAGTTSIIRGALYYRGLDGRKIYLFALSSLINTNGVSLNYSQLQMGIHQSISAESLSSIGMLGFDNFGTALGTATVITMDVYINIGFYGDYAEPDWDSLFTMSKHDHIGLSSYRDE